MIFGNRKKKEAEKTKELVEKKEAEKIDQIPFTTYEDEIELGVVVLDKGPFLEGGLEYIRKKKEEKEAYENFIRRTQNLDTYKNPLDIGFCLARYLGKTKDKELHSYKTEKENLELKVKTTYLPARRTHHVFLQLYQQVGEDWVEISNHSSSTDKWNLSEQNNPDNMEEHLVDEFILKHFNDVKDELFNNKNYFFEIFFVSKYHKKLDKFRFLDPSKNPITIEDLRNLDQRLEMIYSSNELLGIKNYFARESVSNLIERRKEKKDDLKPKGLIRSSSSLDGIKNNILSQNEIEGCTGIAGFRGDLGHAVRSTWEANYARTLIFDEIDYRYEPEQFKLNIPEKSRKIFGYKETVKYIPDFMVGDTNHFVELKSIVGEVPVKKIVLFEKQYPNKELRIIGKPEYDKLIEKYRDKINEDLRFYGWEFGSRKFGDNLSTNPKKFGTRKI